VLAFTDLRRFEDQLTRVVYGTLQHYAGQPTELLILSNAPGEHDFVVPEILTDVTSVHRHWNGGRNDQYSKGLNWMAAQAHYPVLVFLCLNHCRLYDPTWLEDLVKPFNDPRVALAGTLLPIDYRFTPSLGHGRGQQVQGGCFGVSVAFLRAHPYDTQHFPHKYSDVYIATVAQQHGYHLAGVSSVCSVWEAKVAEPPPPGIKLVHDHSHGHPHGHRFRYYQHP